MLMKKNIAIILSGGIGKRLNSNIPKQYLKINNKYIIEITLKKFQDSKLIDEIYVSAHKKYHELINEIAKKNNFSKFKGFFKPGKTRSLSSQKAILSLKTDNESKVLIHEAVRPFVKVSTIDKVIKLLDLYKSVNTVCKSPDALLSAKDNFLNHYIDKQTNFRGLTPQGFRYLYILKAHKLAKKDKFNDVSDDCYLIYKYNLCKVYLYEDFQDNFKITYPSDYKIAKLYEGNEN